MSRYERPDGWAGFRGRGRQERSGRKRRRSAHSQLVVVDPLPLSLSLARSLTLIAQGKWTETWHSRTLQPIEAPLLSGGRTPLLSQILQVKARARMFSCGCKGGRRICVLGGGAGGRLGTQARIDGRVGRGRDFQSLRSIRIHALVFFSGRNPLRSQEDIFPGEEGKVVCCGCLVVTVGSLIRVKSCLDDFAGGVLFLPANNLNILPPPLVGLLRSGLAGSLTVPMFHQVISSSLYLVWGLKWTQLVWHHKNLLPCRTGLSVAQTFVLVGMSMKSTAA